MKTPKNGQTIIETIEKIVKDTEMPYIDAIVYYCEKNDIEIESIGNIIGKAHPNMMAKIEIEAEELNFLEKQSRLPI